MSTKKISELPAGTADPDAVVPATNATLTATEKVALGDIRDLPHAANHQTGGADAVQNVVVEVYPDDTDISTLDITGADIVLLLDSAAPISDTISSIQDMGLYTDGRMVLIVNSSGTSSYVVAHSVGNISLLTGSNLTLPPGASVTLMYDAYALAGSGGWRML